MDSGGFIVVNCREIIKLEADGNYTNIYLSWKRKLTYCRILKEFVDLLRSHHVFFRTHRSFIVNLEHVKSYSKQGIITLTEDHTANLGNSYRDEFIRYFQQSYAC